MAEANSCCTHLDRVAGVQEGRNSRHNIFPGGLTERQRCETALCRQKNVTYLCTSKADLTQIARNTKLFQSPYLEPFVALAVPIGHKAGGTHDDAPSGQRGTSQQIVAILQESPQQGDPLESLAETLQGGTHEKDQSENMMPNTLWGWALDVGKFSPYHRPEYILQ